MPALIMTIIMGKIAKWFNLGRFKVYVAEIHREKYVLANSKWIHTCAIGPITLISTVASTIVGPYCIFTRCIPMAVVQVSVTFVNILIK